MSSAGHVLDMIKRFNNNRQIFVERHYKYEKLKASYQKARKKHIKADYKSNLSEKELAEIKGRIKKEIIRERKRSFILTLIFAPLIIVSAVVLIYYITVKMIEMLT